MNDDYEHCLTTSKDDKKTNQNKSLFNERLKTKELCLSSQCHNVHSYSQERTVSVADEDTKQQAGMIKEDDSFMQLLCKKIQENNLVRFSNWLLCVVPSMLLFLFGFLFTGSQVNRLNAMLDQKAERD